MIFSILTNFHEKISKYMCVELIRSGFADRHAMDTDPDPDPMRSRPDPAPDTDSQH
jgi:hypothetical protein